MLQLFHWPVRSNTSRNQKLALVNLPDGDYHTYSFVDPEKTQQTERISLGTPYGQFTSTGREVLTLELLKKVVSKYYENISEEDFLKNVPYIDTTVLFWLTAFRPIAAFKERAPMRGCHFLNPQEASVICMEAAADVELEFQFFTSPEKAKGCGLFPESAEIYFEHINGT